MDRNDIDGIDWDDELQVAAAMEAAASESARGAEVYEQSQTYVAKASRLHFPHGTSGGRPSIDLRTDEDPPWLRGRHDGLSTCGLLGAYYHDSYEIVIWQRGIDYVCSKLGYNPKHLELVVRLHELAHAILHVGFSDPSAMNLRFHSREELVAVAQACIRTRNWEPDLSETVAQVVTSFALDELHAHCSSEATRDAVASVRRVFLELMEHQPPAYQVKPLLEPSLKARVGEGVRWLIDGDVRPRFDLWRRIIGV